MDLHCIELLFRHRLGHRRWRSRCWRRGRGRKNAYLAVRSRGEVIPAHLAEDGATLIAQRAAVGADLTHVPAGVLLRRVATRCGSLNLGATLGAVVRLGGDVPFGTNIGAGT